MKHGLSIEIELPNGFLKEEVRADYCVSSRMKRVWAIELDLLAKFDSICKKHAIKYCVFAGTLLGAVRHGGFIPWDDDVDVCMDRENFNRLLAIPAEEFVYPYFLQTAYSDRQYYCPYARFRNSATTGVITGMESANYNNGIYMDVFVLDGMPASKMAFIFQNAACKFIEKVINEYKMEQWVYKSFPSTMIRMLRPLWYVIGYERLVRMHTKMLSVFSCGAEWMTFMTHYRKMALKYKIHKSELKEFVKLPFESLEVMAPKNFEKQLSRTYGDYMKFPPAEQRGGWHQGMIEFNPDVPYWQYLKEK